MIPTCSGAKEVTERDLVEEGFHWHHWQHLCQNHQESSSQLDFQLAETFRLLLARRPLAREYLCCSQSHSLVFPGEVKLNPESRNVVRKRRARVGIISTFEIAMCTSKNLWCLRPRRRQMWDFPSFSIGESPTGGRVSILRNVKCNSINHTTFDISVSI